MCPHLDPSFHLCLPQVSLSHTGHHTNSCRAVLKRRQDGRGHLICPHEAGGVRNPDLTTLRLYMRGTLLCQMANEKRLALCFVVCFSLSVAKVGVRVDLVCLDFDSYFLSLPCKPCCDYHFDISYEPCTMLSRIALCSDNSGSFKSFKRRDKIECTCQFFDASV